VPRPIKYFTSCFICLKELPFVDVRPQLCAKCRFAVPEISSNGLRHPPKGSSDPPQSNFNWGTGKRD